MKVCKTRKETGGEKREGGEGEREKERLEGIETWRDDEMKEGGRERQEERG